MSQLVEAFSLGNTAILTNVCILPLYPGLLAFLAGNVGQNTNRTRTGTLGVIVLAGVLSMMMFVGFTLYILNRSFGDVLEYLLPIIYGIVIVLGLLMIGGYNPFKRLQSVNAPIFKNTYGTAYVYGLLLGPMTLPCSGPIIVSAFALGADDTQELANGLLYFLAFGLGFGWPLAVLPLFAAQAQRRFVGVMTRNYKTLTRVSGVLLVGIGIYGFVNEVIPNLTQADDVKIERWEAVAELQDHTERVNDIAFSPNSAYLVSAGGNNDGFFPGTDFGIRVWNVGSQTKLSTWEGSQNRVESVAFSPDGAWLASGGWERIIMIWDMETGAVGQILEGHEGNVNALAFSPDGTILASASDDLTVRLWDVESGQVVATFDHIDRVTSLAFSADGDYLVTGSRDQLVRRWDVGSQELIQTLEGHENWVLSVAVASDGKQVASASADGTIRVWDIENGDSTIIIPDAPENEVISVNSVQFSPDNRFLVAGLSNQSVELWDAETHKRIIGLNGHTTSVSSVTFSPDGKQLASASADGMIWLWRVPQN